MSDTTALSGLPGIVAVAPEVDSFRQLAYLGNNANGRIGGGIGIMNIMMASLRPIEALRYE